MIQFLVREIGTDFVHCDCVRDELSCYSTVNNTPRVVSLQSFTPPARKRAHMRLALSVMF